MEETAISHKKNAAKRMDEGLKEKISITERIMTRMKVIAPIVINLRYSDPLETWESFKT